MNKKQCKALKLNKKQCTRNVYKDSKYCWQHRISRLNNAHWYNNTKIQFLAGIMLGILSILSTVSFGVFGPTKSKQIEILTQTKNIIKSTQENHSETLKKIEELTLTLGIPKEIKGAIENIFLGILKEKDIPQWKWPDKLQEIAKLHQELLDKWQSVQSGDPAVDTLRNQAHRQIELGNYDKADQILQEAVAIDRKAIQSQQEAVDQRRLSMARSLANRAELAKTKLEYQKAIDFYIEALNSLPHNQQQVQARYLNNLGSIYYTIANYKEADLLIKRSLAIRENALDPDHPDVATSLNNLALLYKTQGQYAKADPLYKHSLTIREKTLGPDHPSVATSLNNLAELYRTQGQYAQAEPLYKRSLAIWEKALGPNHPSVATSLNNLAEIYRTQGKYTQAEPLYKRSLEIREKVLGQDHPDVATSLNNLAEMYRTQGQYAQADPLYKHSLEIREKALGPDHPDVATSLNNLALLYVYQGQYAQAEPLYKRSLLIWEKALGPDHPYMATSLDNIAMLYRKTDRVKEAEYLEKRAAAIRAIKR